MKLPQAMAAPVTPTKMSACRARCHCTAGWRRSKWATSTLIRTSKRGCSHPGAEHQSSIKLQSLCPKLSLGVGSCRFIGPWNQLSISSMLAIHLLAPQSMSLSLATCRKGTQISRDQRRYHRWYHRWYHVVALCLSKKCPTAQGWSVLVSAPGCHQS